MASNLLVSTGASDNVPSEINTYQSSAWNAIAHARDALADMVAGVPSLPDSTVIPGQSKGTIEYNKDGSPPTWSFTFNPPHFNVDKPNLQEVHLVDVPDETGSPPAQAAPNIPIRPNPTLPQSPGDAPLINDLLIPPTPEKETISEPKEWAIVIPTSPNIKIKDFTGEKPKNNITIPNTSINWKEDPYSSETLDKIIYNVKSYLDGGVGMPEAIWESIWAKDNDRDNRAALSFKDKIYNEFSDRGFQGLPQGVQAAQLRKVDQTVFNGSQERSREIATKEANLAIENLRFAVTQGIAIEQLRGSWYQSMLERSLKAMLSSAELAISVLNAEISFYNAQVQAFIAEMQAWKTELEGELAKLEVQKSELEAQKLISELNQQEVDKYIALLQSLNINLEYYNSTLESLKIITEQDSLKIEAHSKNVQTYAEKIKAINTVYDGYQTEMQGAKIEADINSVNADIFSKTVEAYSSKNNTEISKANLTINTNQQMLSEYDILLKGFVTELNSKVQDLDANNKAHTAKLSTFTSNLESEKVSVTAQGAARSASAQNADQVTQANIQNAKTNADNALAEAQLIREVYKAIADVEAGYASSAFSATNISMGIRDSATNSANFEP